MPSSVRLTDASIRMLRPHVLCNKVSDVLSVARAVHAQDSHAEVEPLVPKRRL